MSDDEFRLLVKACLKGVRALNMSDEEIDAVVNGADIKAAEKAENAADKLISSYFKKIRQKVFLLTCSLERSYSMDIAQIQAFFFKVMVEGWAVSGQKIKIPDLPGYKAISCRDGDFYLLDHYCTTPNSPKSAGTTTIWFQDVPVWLMNYGGFYEKSAIAFLKRALRKTYQSRLFIGGRGPFIYTENPFVYVNLPRLNNFSKFEGREEIFNVESRISLGFHEYWGISLL